MAALLTPGVEGSEGSVRLVGVSKSYREGSTLVKSIGLGVVRSSSTVLGPGGSTRLVRVSKSYREGSTLVKSMGLRVVGSPSKEELGNSCSSVLELVG